MTQFLARITRSNAFWGWLALLLCMEMLGDAFAGGVARGCDFRAFYAAGHIVRTSSGHLYDLAVQEQVQRAVVSPATEVIPFYHPAYEALLYLPLSMLSFRAAYLVDIALNVMMLGLIFLVGPGHAVFPLARRSRALAFFLFLPVLFTIIVGQDSILFLLICCFALRELRRGDDLLAGCLLGLAIFRPQLAVPLALLLTCRLGWRFLAGFAAVSAPLTLISALIVHREGVAALYVMLGRASMVTSHAAAAQKAIAVYPQRMPNLYGLLYACGTRHLSSHWSFAVTSCASLVLFACCAYVLRRSNHIASTFSIAVLGTVLLSYHFYAYDATILLLPMIMLSGRLHSYLVLACYVLPYVLFFSWIADWFSVFATVPLALLIAAAVRTLHVRRVRLEAGRRETAKAMAMELRAPAG